MEVGTQGVCEAPPSVVTKNLIAPRDVAAVTDLRLQSAKAIRYPNMPVSLKHVSAMHASAMHVSAKRRSFAHLQHRPNAPAAAVQNHTVISLNGQVSAPSANRSPLQYGLL